MLALAACAKTPPPVAPAAQIDGERITFPAGSAFAGVLASAPVEAAQATTLRVPGRMAWDDTRTAPVFSAMAGQVAQIRVAPGASVKAGDVLALVASPSFGEAQSEHARAGADLRQAEKQRSRSRDLQAAGVIAAKDLEEAENNYAHAQAEFARTAARAKLYGGGSAVDQRFPLLAPIAGVVVARHVNPGQEVAPEQAQGDANALFTISDPDHLWLLLDLPESVAGAVQAGQPLEFASGAGTATVSATLDHVDDFVDATSRTVRARASIDNTRRDLKAGQFVQAEITLPADGALDVPAAAVLLIDDRRMVFVDEGGGRYRRQPVDAVEVSHARVHVRGGLQPGERVVVGGALYLQQLLAAQGAS